MPARCFIAVDLPVAARSELAAAQDLLREAVPEWREEKWVKPELLHITLAFLGALPDAALDEVMGVLSESAAGFPQFRLHLTGLRPVQNARHATMIWAAAEATSDLRPLRDALLEAAGCPVDERAFRCHITLARARRPRRIDPAAVSAAGERLSAAGKGPDGSVSVRSLTVYASTLGPSGPAYEPLGQLSLGGGREGTGPIDIEHVFA